MITITIYRSPDGITGYDVKGHSGFAKAGQDIVCAGVSALVQGAMIGLMRHLRCDMESIVDKGLMSMKLLSQPNDNTDAILTSMLLGLKEIADEYCDYVKIEEVQNA